MALDSPDTLGLYIDSVRIIAHVHDYIELIQGEGIILKLGSQSATILPQNS